MKAHLLGGVTTSGQDIDDPEILPFLPSELVSLLWEKNGFILFHGALHVRGAVKAPLWHSVRNAMLGEDAFHRLYSVVEPSDIPFAQDCVGDQFLLRGSRVLRLLAETGELEDAYPSLEAFWQAIAADPSQVLNFNPDTKLEPGYLLHAYPPFCMKPPDSGYDIKPVPAHELILFHTDFAKQLADLPNGAQIRVKVVD